GDKVMVPTGYAEHPREILTPPRSVAKLTYGNITRWTRMRRGGHFPALEAPQQLAEEIRAFFRPLRAQSVRTRLRCRRRFGCSLLAAAPRTRCHEFSTRRRPNHS